MQSVSKWWRLFGIGWITNENNPSENKSIDENDATKKSTPTTDAQQQNDVLAKNQALVTIEKRKKEEDQIYKKIFSSDSSNIVSNSNAFRFASMKATPAKVKCTVKKRKSTSSDKNWNDVYERAEYWCQCSSNKPINTNIGDGTTCTTAVITIINTDGSTTVTETITNADASTTTSTSTTETNAGTPEVLVVVHFSYAAIDGVYRGRTTILLLNDVPI